MFASRLLKEKGVEDFVNAAKLLIHRDIKFVIVGHLDKDNPTSVTLDDLAKWTFDENIEWWGYKDNMEDVIKLATIVVFPSYYKEGVPKILLEAASSGRPVVTTDQPGCRDAIEDGVTGFLVPIKNPKMLAQRIEDLILHPDLLAEMGKNARKLAEENFDVKVIVESHIEIYSNLMRRL
jgi:glycosyltransferase involved in cell wall biosynthesis